ncbi:hypothetical protein C8R47DRAFT_1076295 [Mycena vitilis]|nr:hypothetical protein C8R47DRAFT_1076295 [Mycena vitilis]
MGGLAKSRSDWKDFETVGKNLKLRTVEIPRLARTSQFGGVVKEFRSIRHRGDFRMFKTLSKRVTKFAKTAQIIQFLPARRHAPRHSSEHPWNRPNATGSADFGAFDCVTDPAHGPTPKVTLPKCCRTCVLSASNASYGSATQAARIGQRRGTCREWSFGDTDSSLERRNGARLVASCCLKRVWGRENGHGNRSSRLGAGRLRSTTRRSFRSLPSSDGGMMADGVEGEADKGRSEGRSERDARDATAGAKRVARLKNSKILRPASAGHPFMVI